MPTRNSTNKNSFVKKGHTPIADYLKAKDNLKIRLWRIVGGKLVTPCEGMLLTYEEFKSRYPVPAPVSFNRNPDNVDKTHSYFN